MDTGDVF